MPTARQLRDFEATIRAHPQWPRALCFGDSWFNYPLAPVDLHKQLRRGFRRTAFLNESKAGRESADIKELLPGLRRLLSSYRFTALLVSITHIDSNDPSMHFSRHIPILAKLI